MKINCACGHQILDVTDGVANKAHILPDQDWNDVLDAIDDAIEKSGPSARQKESACMAIRNLLVRTTRMTWQCTHCGALYVDDAQNEAWRFEPAPPGPGTELFRSKAP